MGDEKTPTELLEDYATLEQQRVDAEAAAEAAASLARVTMFAAQAAWQAVRPLLSEGIYVLSGGRAVTVGIGDYPPVMSSVVSDAAWQELAAVALVQPGTPVSTLTAIKTVLVGSTATATPVNGIPQ